MQVPRNHVPRILFPDLRITIHRQSATAHWALAILPPLVRMLFMGLPADWGIWIYRALTFLVISCPCALVISIPLSFFAGIGGASAEGVLVKGSNYLEALAGTRTVVFDKTGTITQGVFEVCGIHGTNCASGSCPVESGHPVYTKEEEQLLEYAALAECHSTHPISISLQKAYGKKLDMDRVTDVQEIGGHGVIATVDGHRVAAGNDKLMKKEKIAYRNCSCTGTIVHLAVDGVYAGHILISDMLKPNGAAAMQALKNSGVHRLVMLTGDDDRVAQQVAGRLELRKYIPNCFRQIKFLKWKNCYRPRRKRVPLPLLEMASMMHLCFPVLTSESLWERLDRMRRLRQQMWC